MIGSSDALGQSMHVMCMTYNRAVQHHGVLAQHSALTGWKQCCAVFRVQPVLIMTRQQQLALHQSLLKQIP
jgi:hypothetical protein